MRNKTFETELPEGYKLAKHINCKDARIGIIMNLLAVIPVIIFMAIAVAMVFIGDYPGSRDYESWKFLLFALSFFLYIVLHELVHGAAYKLLTHQKLTFGITPTVAFCGVPHIYTYRKTALIAICAPFVVFTVVFAVLAAVMYYCNLWLFLLSALLFSTHFGGCFGDLWLMILLNTKYRDPRTLMRDTGPEQFIYVIE